MTTPGKKDPLIGRVLDGYTIEALLGAGGMARVYRGRDLGLGRYVAVKVIEPNIRGSAQYTTRFEREARAIGGLQHPNIVAAYRYGKVDNLHYIVMQYVDGADLFYVLSQYQHANTLMPLADVARLVTQVAAALDYAHARGVIHRDVKPSNVMINREGDAVITDFGLALLAAEGTRGEVFGTPQYIAPEQAMNSAGAVPQSDLYSLGVILYEMLTGTVPFNADSVLDVAMMQMSDTPPSPLERNPALNPAFVPILEKALQKEPRARYANGGALAAAVRKAARATFGAPEAPPTTEPPPTPRGKRKPATETPGAPPAVLDIVAAHRAAHPLPPAGSEAPNAAPSGAPVGTVMVDREAATVVKNAAPKRGRRGGSRLLLYGVAALLVLLLAVVGYVLLFAPR